MANEINIEQRQGANGPRLNRKISPTAGQMLAFDSNSKLVGRSFGFNAGLGGAVTQATDRSTGVTLNKMTGAITMNAASLAAGAEATFTVTNSFVAATDVPVVAIKSSSTGTPSAYVSAVAAGSFNITVTNLHASTADTTADVINFVIIKGAAS
jgi:hypothetical protein